jgi:hypothetical protein
LFVRETACCVFSTGTGSSCPAEEKVLGPSRGGFWTEAIEVFCPVYFWEEEWMRRIAMLFVGGALFFVSFLTAPVHAQPSTFRCGVLVDPCQIICQELHKPCL